MTTVAFDGKTMAADTLSVDTWGLRDRQKKIWHNAQVVIGAAGEYGQILGWYRTLTPDTTIDDLLREGYPKHHKDDNNPTIMIVDRATMKLYKSSHGQFVPSTHKQHAVGSGQDFARTAMYLGKTAREAVEIANLFDNNTGAEVVEVTI